MKKSILAMFLSACLLFPSCSFKSELSRSVSQMQSLCKTNGGYIEVYTPESRENSQRLFAAMYGVGARVPDELSLIDFAVLWHLPNLNGGDGAIFYVTNKTDIRALEKMCLRRQKTVKRAVGIDMKIISSGHYVGIYSENIPELEATVNRICKGS